MTYDVVSESMMKILFRALNWFGGCLRSPVGWVFLTFHAVWFFVAVMAMGPPSRSAAQFWDSFVGADWVIFAGRPFHFYYEPLIVKSLLVADLPANVVAAMADLCVSPLWRVFHLGTYEASYVAAGKWLLVGSLQWLAIGRLLELSWWRRKFSRTP
jgi:hypothetical protein